MVVSLVAYSTQVWVAMPYKPACYYTGPGCISRTGLFF